MAQKLKKDQLTDRKADEQEALQFVSLVVHDLEVPLVSLKTLLRFLNDDRFDPSKPTHQKLLESSKIALERAEALRDDLLSSARASRLKMNVGIGDVDLKAAVTDACIMAQAGAGENGVTILYRLPSNAITVKADHLLLGRILDNLIYNATRHTPSGGEINVEVIQKKTTAEIVVSDGGTGFGEGVDPEQLFELYNQADYRSRGLTRGVGIGLYFCRLAVTEMNGSIKAENSKNSGAVFRCNLPIGGIPDEK